MPIDRVSTRVEAHSVAVLDGEHCHVIADAETMAPFMLSLTSASDVWAFLTSNGGITAGRRSSDHAIFPYFTEDLVRDAAGTTGSTTRITATVSDDSTITWEPFGPTHPNLPAVSRTIAKTDLGDVVHLEEHHSVLDLTFRVTWRVSPTFGLIRTATLSRGQGSIGQAGDRTPAGADRATAGITGAGAVEGSITIIDGLQHFLPPGVTARTHRELGPLLDAYKITELDPSGLAWVRLNARLTDRAEASEALAVTTVWESGLPQPSRSLSAESLTHWSDSSQPVARGERAAYLTRAEIQLNPGQSVRWHMAVDVDQDATDVVALRRRLARPEDLVEQVEADIAAGRAQLRALVGSVDGFTSSGDPMADAHHASSAMFNIMRGGVPAAGDTVDRADLRRFLTARNRPLVERWHAVLRELPERLSIHELRSAAAQTGDPDLIRLTGEYVPLTFSRRHGDPSRPWNSFEIVVTDEQGNPQLGHQGNWRDIFQNWEALAWSFPSYTESFVRTFLNATTIDGYNPYRISREGVDWEIPEPENPWSNIGYWSDHQIIYLARLLELLAAQHPDRLSEMAHDEQFVLADVPYTLASYAELLVDPQNSVTFDEERQERVMERVARLGGDGRLRVSPGGGIARASLTEKLLTLTTAKLVNFVPDGGIWMNTQRPEWNDANNALVGRGLSVVTVAYLHRFLGLVESLIDELPLTVSAALAQAVEAVTQALATATAGLDTSAEAPLTDADRRQVLDALGAAGTAYRYAVSSEEGARQVTLSRDLLRQHLRLARSWMARTVRLAKRADGLYHGYNLLALGDGVARIDHLDEMLEGQVAVLSAGVLDGAAVDALLAALPTSRLYRPDVNSYQLYPEPHIPTFLERNAIQQSRWQGSALVRALVEAGDRRLVVVDEEGQAHFAAGLRNADDIRAVLADLARHPQLAAVAAAGGEDLLDMFEEVFQHAAYTGRSSSFFAYEGVGSVYWHMVSKLMLAVREHLDDALRSVAPDVARIERLRTAYEQVRSGLGFCKTAHEYGAFPHDAYSHTPAGKGARQPGMTGQVKEDVLARWADFGVGYAAGRIRIDGSAPAPRDWEAQSRTLSVVGVDGRDVAVELPADSIGLTIAQTPVVLRRSHTQGSGMSGSQFITVLGADGAVIETTTDEVLSAEVSADIMNRTGRVARVEVTCAQ